MKNRKNIHKAWKVGLLGVTACFLLGGCGITKATDAEQGGNNEVIATRAEQSGNNAVIAISAEQRSNSEVIVTDAEQSSNNEVIVTNAENAETTSDEDASTAENTGNAAVPFNTTNTATTTNTTTTASVADDSGKMIGGGLVEQVSTETSQNVFIPRFGIGCGSERVYKRVSPDSRIILMDIEYPSIGEFRENSDGTLYKIFDQINKECEAGALKYKNDYEAIANDEFNEKTNWEDDSYFYYAKGYLRRMDEKVFSMVEYTESYAHGAHPSHYYNSYNYDMTTGSKITLSNLVTDKEALYKAIKSALLEKYDANIFLDDTTLITTLHDYVCNPSYGEMNFTIEKDGVSFWFSDYDLTAYSEGCQMVIVPFKGNEALFRKEYVTTDEDFVKMVAPGVEYKLSSGHTLQVYDGYYRSELAYLDDDPKNYVDLEIVYDNTINRVTDFDGFDSQMTFWVHKNGKDYLYCQANGYSDDDYLLIYTLGGTQLGDAKYPSEEIALSWPMVNTDHVALYTRVDIFATMLLDKDYHIDEDGMPRTDQAYFELGEDGPELTLLRDFTADVAANDKSDVFTSEVLKAGTTMTIFKTDGKDMMDLKLNDGRIVRLQIDFSKYPHKINGIEIDEEELFDGLGYCD